MFNKFIWNIGNSWIIFLKCWLLLKYMKSWNMCLVPIWTRNRKEKKYKLSYIYTLFESSVAFYGVCFDTCYAEHRPYRPQRRVAPPSPTWWALPSITLLPVADAGWGTRGWNNENVDLHEDLMVIWGFCYSRSDIVSCTPLLQRHWAKVSAPLHCPPFSPSDWSSTAGPWLTPLPSMSSSSATVQFL